MVLFNRVYLRSCIDIFVNCIQNFTIIIVITKIMEVKLNTDKWLFQTFNAQKCSNIDSSKFNKQVSTMVEVPCENAYGISQIKSNLYSCQNNAYELNKEANIYRHNFTSNNHYQVNKNDFFSQTLHFSPIKTNNRQNSINSRYIQMSKQTEQPYLSISRNKNEVIDQILQNIRKFDSPRRNQIDCNNKLVQRFHLTKTNSYSNIQKTRGKQQKQFKGLRQTIFDRANRDIIDKSNFQQKNSKQIYHQVTSDLNNNHSLSPLKRIDEKRRNSIQRKGSNFQQNKTNIYLNVKQNQKQSNSTQKQVQFMKNFCTQPLSIKSSSGKYQVSDKQNKITNSGIRQPRKNNEKFDLEKNFLKEGNRQNQYKDMKKSNGRPPKSRPLSKSPSAQLFNVKQNKSLDKHFKLSPINLFTQKKQIVINEYYNQLDNGKMQKLQKQLDDFRNQFRNEQQRLKLFYSELETKIKQTKTMELMQLKKYEQIYQKKFQLCKEIVRKQNATHNIQSLDHRKKTSQYEQCDSILKNVRQSKRNMKVVQQLDINFPGFLSKNTNPGIFGRQINQQKTRSQIKQPQKCNTFSFDNMII